MVNVEVKVGRMLLMMMLGLHLLLVKVQMLTMIKGEEGLLVKGKDDILDDNGEDADEDLDNDTRVGAGLDVLLLWIMAMMRMNCC